MSRLDWEKRNRQQHVRATYEPSKMPAELRSAIATRVQQMGKLITVRYNGKCALCQEPIPAGSKAVWFPREKALKHQRTDCPLYDSAET